MYAYLMHGRVMLLLCFRISRVRKFGGLTGWRVGGRGRLAGLVVGARGEAGV
jgi:hypothetical protein